MPRVDGDKDLHRPAPRVKLYVPDLPLVYKANKIFQMLQRIDKQLAKDPLYIPIKDYIYLVNENEKCNIELVKQGLGSASGRAKARMEQKKLDKSGYSFNKAGVGEEESSGLDDGVPAVNPFA